MSRTVLITGCSSGFGRAAALKFKADGWNVVATMRHPDRWNHGEDRDRLLVLPLDVHDDASITAVFYAAIERFGRIDVVVNNAGQGLFSVFEATPEETMRSVFETNVFGPMKLMRAAIPLMREAGGGRIVNVTSGSAIVPEPLMAVYTATKAALDSFTEAVMFELAPQNIVLKLVVPGFAPGTKFVEQTQAAARNIPIPTEYSAYFDQRVASFMLPPPVVLATDADVANAIVAASIDETGKLRWLVGPDVREFSHMRWETSEAEYGDWMRRRFAPA